jgi:N6-adenosine-specific RNA methylase IME4
MPVKHNPQALSVFYPPFPSQTYDIIYADPPWHYENKFQYDKKETTSGVVFHYPTISTNELKKLPVQEISKENCLLFMWTTNPHLAQAIELGEAWGFEYKTVAFVWDKMNHNPGKYTLSYCELCLLFKRGKIPQPRGARNVKQLVSSKRKNHSQKPIEVLEGIEKMFPKQTRIELFARTEAKGWDSWGIEVDRGQTRLDELARFTIE